MDGDASADEHSRGQAGESLAAAAAGRVSPGVVTNHHASLLKVPKTLLQVATETLKRKFREHAAGDISQQQQEVVRKAAAPRCNTQNQ